ncbi:unnamed protein product [Phytophthora fragariaefolia]|uniref:Unnamed protein product n=1 Tax=Phytophthora fragariaefolia TaxID=1490495 RepID=A0A9W6Y491_9STRA|nr:unnamed protein product [Phytophthora fragariaefolia]
MSMPPPAVEWGESLLAVSFDGSARVKHGGDAYGAIVWKRPGSNVLAAASKYAPDLTGNETERTDETEGGIPSTSQWDGRMDGADSDPCGKDAYRRYNQRDWDEYAERLTFALNTAHDLPGPWLGLSDDVGIVVALSQRPLARSRPAEVALVSNGVDRFGFDDALLSEDSREVTLAEDEFELDQIADVRSGRRTGYGCVHGGFPVYWKGYAEPTGVDEADLDSRALLQEFERKMADRNRFLQSHEESEE